MKRLLVLIGFFATGLFCPATAQTDNEALQKRLAALEKRVAHLEKKVAVLAGAGDDEDGGVLGELQKKARERMQKDSYYYTQQQLKRIDQLYREAEKDWNSNAALNAFGTLVETFPKANRTGCAMVQIAKTSKGADRVELLKMAITNYGDCRYADGVQIEPYARFLLGLQKYEAGNKKEAAKQFKIIREKFPEAVDHRGRLLRTVIPQD